MSKSEVAAEIVKKFTSKKDQIPALQHHQEFRFPPEVDCARFFIDYEYRPGGTIPRLSVGVYINDDRVCMCM